jgi:hypothetical protein
LYPVKERGFQVSPVIFLIMNENLSGLDRTELSV